MSATPDPVSVELRELLAIAMKLVSAGEVRTSVPHISHAGRRVVGWKIGQDAIGLPSEQLNCVEAIEHVLGALPHLLDTLTAYEKRIGELEAEVARLKRPSLFWIDEDPETGYIDPWEAAESALYHTDDEGIAAIREGCELGVRYYARLRPDDDLDIDECWLKVFDTAAEAEAAVSAERARRAALTLSRKDRGV